MTIQTIDRETYYRERAICDRATRYAERIMCEGGDKRARNYLTAEEAADPAYCACNNEMRGRVQQFEILHNPPDRLVAYIGGAQGNGMGCAGRVGQSYPVTVWTGTPIGNATRGAGWRVDSYVGSYMYQFYANIAGREYTGRGFGEGMSIVLRETAESKRKRGAF